MLTTPEALTRQWFTEVWDEGREDAIDRLLAPDGIVHLEPTQLVMQVIDQRFRTSQHVGHRIVAPIALGFNAIH